MRLRLLSAVVWLMGASAITTCGCFAHWCLFAYYVRLFCLRCVFAYSVRLICLSLHGSSLTTSGCFTYRCVCVHCFASCCVFLHSMCACFAYWCVFACYLRLFCLLVCLRHYTSLVAFQYFICCCRRVLISQSRPNQQNNLRMDASLSLRYLPGVILTIGALDEKQALKFE